MSLSPRSIAPVKGAPCRVNQILIADSPQNPVRPVGEARAVAGRGLEGDRYFFGKGTFTPATPKPEYEITLIEKENIDGFEARCGFTFTAVDARRNIVTEGIRLNHLVGKRFFVGEALLCGICLCEPCNHLPKAKSPERLEALAHQCGLRAQIVSGGQIRVGDPIRVEPA